MQRSCQIFKMKTPNELIEELRAIAYEPTWQGISRVEEITEDVEDPVVLSYIVAHFSKYFKLEFEKLKKPYKALLDLDRDTVKVGQIRTRECNATDVATGTVMVLKSRFEILKFTGDRVFCNFRMSRWENGIYQSSYERKQPYKFSFILECTTLVEDND